ncbi:hypothetical protein QBC39DRAFT_117082 [Podospora conica]|nr:hypothetical protein QBC39DRAFT_117082 [Schizothecium conicum]
MFECGDCSRAFPAGWSARENHCRATGHSRPRFECDKCDAHFRNERARWNHMSQANHFDWDCQFCDETWPNEEALDNHYIDDHNWCESCDRWFQNSNNIRAHLNSRIHRGQNICCPFCSSQFTTATGMVHHLERGGCSGAPRLNRDEIYRFVRSRDPSGIISKKLIGWTGEEDVTYEANNRAWNGSGYECYLCHKEFSLLQGLNQHLNSAVRKYTGNTRCRACANHRSFSIPDKQALYHCPNLACRANFKTLAAIINHLESESCGAVRFDKVQQRVSDIFRSGRTITFT